MRILLSSLFAFLLVGCASYPKKKGFKLSTTAESLIINPYFSSTANDYVYKAKINAFDKSFGGIFIVKKLKHEQHRVVFTTEMGNTIFDFEFQGDELKINRILPEMDKKLLINLLKMDFLVLIKESSPALRSYSKENSMLKEVDLLSKKHYYAIEDGQLKKIVRTGSGKEKVAFLFSGISDNIVKKIQITHQNIKVKIVLTAF